MIEPGPTPAQLRVMAAYVRTGSQKATANELGISAQTVKNHLSALYAVVDASGAMEALTRLGWIALPSLSHDQPTCGWVGYCSRPRGHLPAAAHNGMRAFVRTELA